MGSVRTSPSTTAFRPFARAVDVVAGGVLLVLTLPLIGALALAVRLSSNGPVLRRERTRDQYGRPVELLSFRATLDGAGTTHHERLRAVVGANDARVLTGVGRLMRITRTERLPRLLNIVRGEASLI